jgi:hypothetical protein
VVADSAVTGNYSGHIAHSKGVNVKDKEAGLERLLGELAAHYDRQHPPAGAADRIKRRLSAERRVLSDNDLDWLAAAGGEPMPPPEDDPEQSR